MKVVFLKRNNYVFYDLKNIKGYLFNPRNKNIKSLVVVKEEFIKRILSKKIKRELFKIKKTIFLIVSSDATIISDCDMMINEVLKVTKKLDRKYSTYFNEFEYFDYIKELYLLYNMINYKKDMLD